MSPTYKLAAVLAAIQVLPGLCIAAPTATVAKDDGFSSVQIIGGSSAGLGEFPFLVSLSQDGKHLCGGALLDANTVLTAAHCSAFQAADAARVRAGSNVCGRLCLSPPLSRGTTQTKASQMVY